MKYLKNLCAGRLMALFLVIATIASLLVSGTTASAQDTVKVVMNEPQVQLRSTVIPVSPEIGAFTVPMAQFTLTAVGGDVKIKRIDVDSDEEMVNTYYLYRGNQFIAATGVLPTGNSLFAELNLPKDTSVTLTVAVNLTAEAPTITIPNRYASLNVNITNVTFEKADQSTGFAQGFVIGNSMFPRYEGAIFSLDSTPTIATYAGQNGTTAHVTAVFPLNEKAFGASVMMPTPDLFRVRFTDIVSGDVYQASGIGVSVIPGSDIGDGSNAKVTITATLNGNDIKKSGLYHANLYLVGWKTADTTVTQNWGLETFVTGITNVASSGIANMRIISSELYADQTFGITAIVPNASFSLQTSQDLVNWQTGTMMSGTEQVGWTPDGMRIFRIFTFGASSTGKRFFRVTVP